MRPGGLRGLPSAPEASRWSYDSLTDRVAVTRVPATPRAAVASDLLYLFDRPAEPVFTLRGLRRDTAFDVPDSYLVRCGPSFREPS